MALFEGHLIGWCLSCAIYEIMHKFNPISFFEFFFYVIILLLGHTLIAYADTYTHMYTHDMKGLLIRAEMCVRLLQVSEKQARKMRENTFNLSEFLFLL